VSRSRSTALNGVFFLSGAAGLVYQVVWSRLLNELFGVSAYAVTAVLATYLGGLALGSWKLGPLVDRSSRPLRIYGLLEIGIGVSALAGTWLVRALDPIHAWAASRLSPASVALLVIRMALASAVVLPPTVLMGATLPAMSRALVRSLSRVGREVAFLYAINTAGAVAGSLAAGFVLIRALGVHPTLWVAVGVNVAVGVIAVAMSRAADAADGPPEPHAARDPDGPGPSTSGTWLLWAMALSGFASLSLEVIWTRMLVLVLGTNTYAFVTMLSSFLVGIALGSLLSRRLVDRLVNRRRAFGWLQLAIAATTLATVPLVRAVLSGGRSWFPALDSSWTSAVLGQFGLSFLVMLVPTTLIGATFPLAARIWARDIATLGGRLGQVYGANTFGNILGALAGGFVILPRFGMQRGIALLVLANLAAAACALLRFDEGWWRPRSMLRVAPISAGLWTCVVLLVMWRPGPLPQAAGERLDPVRFYREGLVSTVSVFQRASDGRQLVMSVDGVQIGQTAAGVDRKQKFLAHIPFLLEPRPLRNVLSVGLGTGILIGEVARHPGVERIECVELSPSVIEGARLFTEYNGGILDDPRTRIVNDDGISYLRRSRETYDAIISDGKSRSGHAGNAVFYSEDYYLSARDHLAEHGVMAQWVPLDVTLEDLQIIVRTFSSVFEHAYLWLGPRSCFLVGMKHPLALDLEAVQRALDAPATAALRQHGWTDAAELAGTLLADGADLRRWAGAGPLNSLERPVLEFYPFHDAPAGDERLASNLQSLTSLRPDRQDPLVASSDERVAAEARSARALLVGLVSLARDEAWGARATTLAIAQAPARGVLHQVAAEALFDLARSLDLRGNAAEATAVYEEAVRTWPDLAEGWVNLGRLAGMLGRRAESEAYLRRALATNPLSSSAHEMLGRLRSEAGDGTDAVRHLREAIRISPLDAEKHESLGLSLAMTQKPNCALTQFREALRLAPDWPEALERVALLLATHPDSRSRQPAEGLRLATRAVALTSEKDPMALEVQAAAFASNGRFAEAEGAERKVLSLAIASHNDGLESAARALIDRYGHGLMIDADQPPAQAQ
jgi:spermidine synthase